MRMTYFFSLVCLVIMPTWRVRYWEKKSLNVFGKCKLLATDTQSQSIATKHVESFKHHTDLPPYILQFLSCPGRDPFISSFVAFCFLFHCCSGQWRLRCDISQKNQPSFLRELRHQGEMPEKEHTGQAKTTKHHLC